MFCCTNQLHAFMVPHWAYVFYSIKITSDMINAEDKVKAKSIESVKSDLVTWNEYPSKNWILFIRCIRKIARFFYVRIMQHSSDTCSVNDIDLNIVRWRCKATLRDDPTRVELVSYWWDEEMHTALFHLVYSRWE